MTYHFHHGAVPESPARVLGPKHSPEAIDPASPGECVSSADAAGDPHRGAARLSRTGNRDRLSRHPRLGGGRLDRPGRDSGTAGPVRAGGQTPPPPLPLPVLRTGLRSGTV